MIAIGQWGSFGDLNSRLIQPKNRSVCENAVTGIWGNCRLLVMRSWSCPKDTAQWHSGFESGTARCQFPTTLKLFRDSSNYRSSSSLFKLNTKTETILTHWLLCRPWRTLAFLPLLTSSLLHKIGIIYIQLRQEKKIFPMMHRSEWSAEWSLRYAQKSSKSWVNNSEQNFLPLHLAAPWWKLPISMTLSYMFFNRKQSQ